MNETKVLHKLYAQPLLSKKGEPASEICKEYYSDLSNYKVLKYQEEAQIWLLLSYIHDESFAIPEFYKHIISKNPKLERYIRYFLWLCKIYNFTRKDKQTEYSLFEYIRSGESDKFKEKVQLLPDDEGWKSLTFSGAFSSTHFKLWRETVYNISKRDDVKDNINLYLSLAGDKKVNKKYEKNIFDKMWTQIYSIICLAASDKQYKFSFGNISPNENSQFESMAFSVFKDISNDIDALYSNPAYPLIFRVHVAAVFNKLPVDLLQVYIRDLVSERLIGLIAFYASLADPDNSLSILTDVLAAFDPSKDIIDIIKSFNIDEAELVCKIVERLSKTTIEDFESEIDKGKITEMQIKCLEWLSIVKSMENRALLNVRKIISSLVLNDEYAGARIVFDKFSKLFNNKKEWKCWQILIYAELEYMEWSKSDKTSYPKSSFNNLVTILKNVIRFPGGWMIDCPDVDIEVGSHCIPLIADHLFDVYMSNNKPDESMGISIYIWDSYTQIKRYFNNDNLKHFLLLSKEAFKECSRKSSRISLKSKF